MSAQSDLESVLASLLQGVDTQAIAATNPLEGSAFLQNAQAALETCAPHKFQHAVLYPLGQIAMGIVATHFGTNWKARFLFLQADFVMNHVRRLIEEVEGSACCADKTRTILQALGRHLLQGKDIVFNYNQEYTYHLPKKVLTNQEDILLFFNGVQHLYSGNTTPYLEALLKIKAKANSGDANQ